MIIAVYVVHILVCLALIVIVLLQTGKGADMGATFGGASQTVFGSTGRQTFLTQLTAGAAVVFMLTCLFLAWYSSSTVSKGVMKDFEETPAVPTGAAPDAGVPAPLVPPGPPAAGTAPAGGEAPPSAMEMPTPPAPPSPAIGTPAEPTPKPETPPAPAPTK